MTDATGHTGYSINNVKGTGGMFHMCRYNDIRLHTQYLSKISQLCQFLGNLISINTVSGKCHFNTRDLFLFFVEIKHLSRFTYISLKPSLIPSQSSYYKETWKGPILATIRNRNAVRCELDWGSCKHDSATEPFIAKTALTRRTNS